MADQHVAVRPLRSEEYDAAVSASKAGYAHDVEILGGQTREAALKKAEADFAAILPQGLATAGHLLQVIEADGR